VAEDFFTLSWRDQREVLEYARSKRWPVSPARKGPLDGVDIARPFRVALVATRTTRIVDR
jgi:hypothetical protein